MTNVVAVHFFYYNFDLFALHELKKKINGFMTDLREIHSDIKQDRVKKMEHSVS